jgi:hypothetical protein
MLQYDALREFGQQYMADSVAKLELYKPASGRSSTCATSTPRSTVRSNAAST